MALLQVKGLSISFGGVKAVSNVSFDVEPGEIKAIIGPNGAGKTTLFNLITGYTRCDSGEVHLKGHKVTGLPAREVSRRGMGRAFQVSQIFSRLTVFENVQVALLSKYGKVYNLWSPAPALFKDEVLNMLGTVGLGERAGEISGTLSHGDQKSLDIAIALARGAELLLLDEPTAGMSPEESLVTTELIRKLVKEKGITVLFTEHDMDVVFAIAGSLIVLHRGQIICEGKPDEVRCNKQVQQVYFGEKHE